MLKRRYKEGHYQGGECFFPSLNFSDGNFVSLREFHVLYLIIAKDLIRGGKDRSHNIRQEILTPENIGSTITCVPEKVMNIGETLYVTNRENWREWLVKNFDKEKEIWLVYPHKSSSKSRISYNDAVEEALCFGWIDSILKKHNHESSLQRFSPRNPKTPFSQPNKERLRLLLKEDRLHPTIVNLATQVLKEKFVFPVDIIDVLKRDKEAWRNYKKFSPAYQRIRIAYIDAARKRPEEFKKRLNNFVQKTKQNIQIGYGGIEKYY